MKLLLALCSVVASHRTNTLETIGPVNQLAAGRFALTNFDNFMQDESATMTKWTGETTLTFEKRRKIGLIPWYNIHEGAGKTKGDRPLMTWKSWFNPYANARRSVRNVEGQTINRVHSDQLRLSTRARHRSYITTPGKRSQTFYTMSWLGSKMLGKHKEKKETGHHFPRGRTTAYNMGKGMCRGNFQNKRCKGRLYTAKSFSSGYEIVVYKGQTAVATAKMMDLPMTFKDKYLLGEKVHYAVKIEDGQDNLAITEFMTWIREVEEWAAMVAATDPTGLLGAVLD